MTTAPRAPREASRAGVRLHRQLRSIDRWHDVRRRELSELTDERIAAVGREQQIDATRRRDALDRVHLAVLEHADARLRGEAQAWDAVTAVIAHRHPWAAQRIEALLRQHGVVVVGTSDNGAEALGQVVVDQPDVLLVNETLAMLTGCQVIEHARELAPETATVALVNGLAGARAAASAGATATCLSSRPADIVDRVTELLPSLPSGPTLLA